MVAALIARGRGGGTSEEGVRGVIVVRTTDGEVFTIGGEVIGGVVLTIGGEVFTTDGEVFTIGGVVKADAVGRAWTRRRRKGTGAGGGTGLDETIGFGDLTGTGTAGVVVMGADSTGIDEAIGCGIEGATALELAMGFADDGVLILFVDGFASLSTFNTRISESRSTDRSNFEELVVKSSAARP